MSAPAPAPARCPSCQARLAATARWCLQCYEPIPATGPSAPAVTAGPAPPPARDAGGPGHAERVAEEMLLTLAADEGGRPVGAPGPLVRRVGPLLATRGGRAALTTGMTVAVSLLVLALMAVLGALLG